MSKISFSVMVGVALLLGSGMSSATRNDDASNGSATDVLVASLSSGTSSGTTTESRVTFWKDGLGIRCTSTPLNFTFTISKQKANHDQIYQNLVTAALTKKKVYFTYEAITESGQAKCYIKMVNVTTTD